MQGWKFSDRKMGKMFKGFPDMCKRLFFRKCTVFLAFLLLLFYGCGPPYIQLGKTAEQLDADDKACKASALEVCPPKLEWNSGEESLRLRMGSSREREYHWWDANLDRRSIVYNGCMENKGWKKR